MKGLTLAVAVISALTFTTAGPAAADCCDSPCDVAGNCCDTGGCETNCCDAVGCDVGCCDTNCCDSCAMCGHSGLSCNCLGRMKLLGIIKPSERCFDDFISPMINFVFFEDPRTLTELRPIFVHHNLPNTLSGGAVSAGGAVQLFAAQFRIALSDRLSLIAVKDGYIVDKVNDGVLDTLLDDGWADVSVGLKYNVLRNTCTGTLGSVGFTYEIPVGSRRAQQGIADGEFHLFGTAGQRLWNGNGHLLSSFGWRKPVDGQLQTESVHWSNHFDVRVTDQVYLVTEVAWWHWIDSAEAGLGINEAGHDLFNLSAANVDDNDLVTQNVGIKVKPRRNIEAGLAYEFPLTGFQDVIDDRIQFDLILRY